jgi:ABC-type transport system involved in multi-copper enzyme maturation permease subunit
MPMSSVSAVLIIARLTLREAFRRRLLWALFGLTVVIVVLTAWGFAQLDRALPIDGPLEMLGLSQVLILLAFMFSFVLTMTAVFAASPAIGPEIESGLLLAVLARPIRRSEVLVGRWLGLGVVVVAYALGASYLELGVVGAVTGYYPADPVMAPPYLAAQALVLLTLALVFSTRIASVASGAIAVVAYGLTWMAGIMGSQGDLFRDDGLRTAGTIARLLLPSDVLWRGSMHALSPPPDVMASVTASGASAATIFQASPFFAGSPPSLLWLAWCAIWVVAALAIGSLLLRRREL